MALFMNSVLELHPHLTTSVSQLFSHCNLARGKKIPPGTSKRCYVVPASVRGHATLILLAVMNAALQRAPDITPVNNYERYIMVLRVAYSTFQFRWIKFTTGLRNITGQAVFKKSIWNRRETSYMFEKVLRFQYLIILYLGQLDLQNWDFWVQYVFVSFHTIGPSGYLCNTVCY